MDVSKYLKFNKLPMLILNILSLAIVVAAIYTSFSFFFLNGSLWYDEAMLALSISGRSLGDLTTEPLVWNQTAPVIYLYIVKLITLVFGNTEWTLRLWSFISYLGVIALVYYILKNILKVKLSLLGCALVANLPILLKYSNEFKPYMSDAFSILLVVIIYFLYNEKKINEYWAGFVFACLLWYSNPSCFFIGGVLVVQFLHGVIEKDRVKIKTCFVWTAMILVSFIIYFFYWLKPVIDVGYMKDFWSHKNFPLIPTSYEDILYQSMFTREIFQQMGQHFRIIFAVIACGLFVNLIYWKNKYINLITAGIFITLFASMLGMYPIQDRLYLFMYPLIGILLFFVLDKLCSRNSILTFLNFGLSLYIITTANGFSHYQDENNYFFMGQEIRPAIQFVDENIKETDFIYVHPNSIPAYAYYKKKYDLNENDAYESVKMGNSTDLGIIKDAKTIREHNPSYIITSQIVSFASVNILLDSLNNHGEVKLVHDKYRTNVYKYTSNSEE